MRHSHSGTRLSRRQVASLILLIVFGIAGMPLFFPSTSISLTVFEADNSHRNETACENHPREPALEWSSKKYVSSLTVTGRFRDNLRPDLSYITTFCVGGLTNQFMCYANMIYLGMLSNRVPVIPCFTPSHHIDFSGGMLEFGDVFDLDSLRTGIRGPALQWADIKTVPKFVDDAAFGTATENLGCWNTAHRNPANSSPYWKHLHLDVSYTNVPAETFIDQYRSHGHTNLWNIAALIYPQSPLYADRQYTVQWPSDSGISVLPDEHMSCFDSTYYMGSGAAAYEWERTWSPVWRFVGTHLKFTTQIEQLADSYVRTAFALRSTAAIPPYISIHVRHGDFVNDCSDKARCFAPLSTYAARVEEIKSELWAKQRVQVERVLISSDETSPEFWSEATSRGWDSIDHIAERTEDKFGKWFPPIVDVVVQSRASGFVGTAGSTLSLVSARRVEDWSNGPSRLVKWGASLGADSV